MTILYNERNKPQLENWLVAPLPSERLTIETKEGYRVEFFSEVHGIIHTPSWSYNWRYEEYELEVQNKHQEWVSHYWTPLHKAIDWAVEQRKLRDYVSEIQNNKVIDLEEVRRNKEESTQSQIYEYAISYYTEVNEEGIPIEDRKIISSLFAMNDAKIKLYMDLLHPGCVVMDWNQRDGYDEF